MSSNYLPRCDNDDNSHLYCHPNHHASPNPTLWLCDRHSVLRFAWVFLIAVSFFLSQEEETEVQRDETIVSKGSSQDSIRNAIAVPPGASASHSPWQLSFCSILGGGPGSNTQGPQEEAREGSVTFPKRDSVDAPSLRRTYSFQPVDSHSVPYLILVIILWRIWGKRDELLIIDVVAEGLGGDLPEDTWVITSTCLQS